MTTDQTYEVPFVNVQQRIDALVAGGMTPKQAGNSVYQTDKRRARALERLEAEEATGDHQGGAGPTNKQTAINTLHKAAMQIQAKQGGTYEAAHLSAIQKHPDLARTAGQ